MASVRFFARSPRVAVTVAIWIDSRPPSSVVKSSPYPSAVHAMSFSRAAVAVTRRADPRPSSGRTQTSPNATIAIVLPSGLSAASVVAVARLRS